MLTLLSEEKLDRESFGEIVEKGKQQIQGLYPGWTDFNIHDPGITMIELMAWFKEIQMFHMDQIGPAHLRKYLKLLGVRPRPGRAGHGWITISTLSQVEIEAGTRLGAGSICFETARSQVVAEGIFQSFITVTDEKQEILQGEWLKEGKGLRLHPFGISPRVGNQFIVCLAQVLQTEKRYCLYIENGNDGRKGKNPVEEGGYDGYGFYPLAVMEAEYRGVDGWEPLMLEEDQTYGMCQSGGIYFRLNHIMDKEKPQIQFCLRRSDYAAPPAITRISLAMVEARQQETRRDRPVFFGNGFPNQRFSLEDERIDRSQFRLVGWELVEDFDCSGPEDRHYILESGVLQFGDCIHGLAPEGEITVMQYVRTLAEKGNVKSGAVSSIEGIPEGMVKSVTNEKDVTSGRAEETMEETLKRGRAEETMEEALKRGPGESGEINRRRAVTLSDYENLVRGTPGLWIEECRAYSLKPQSNRIIIAVRPFSPDGAGVVNPAYEKNIYRYLEEKRLIGTRISVISPEYVYLTVTCCVVGKVKYRDVRERVESALKIRLEGKTFGEGISYGLLHGFIDSLPCVKLVKSVWIDSGGRGRRNERGDLLLPPNGLIRLREVCCSILTDTEEKM